MSSYELQKAILQVNRNPEFRERFSQEPADATANFELSSEERAALTSKDYRALYRLGVHGLILRPFSIINGVSESDYLTAIRGES